MSLRFPPATRLPLTLTSTAPPARSFISPGPSSRRSRQVFPWWSSSLGPNPSSPPISAWLRTLARLSPLAPLPSPEIDPLRHSCRVDHRESVGMMGEWDVYAFQSLAAVEQLSARLAVCRRGCAVA